MTTAQTLKEGLLPALARLAELPLLRNLARWPNADERWPSVDDDEGVGKPVDEP